MKKIFFLLFVQFSLNIFAQDTDGIKFEHDQTLAQLLQKAGAENKLLFIDCYTTWCGPCKYLSGKIFPLKEVGDYYNPKFICAKFDMKQGEGIEIAKKYQIKAYPTMLFLNSKGEIVHMKVGAGDANLIVEFGKQAGDEENNYKAVISKLKKGDFSASNINKFLSIDPYSPIKDSILNIYFTTIKEPEKASKETWDLINYNIEDYDNQFFKLLLKNEVGFKKIADPKEVDNKISQVFINYINKNRKDEKKSAEVEKELKALNHPQVQKAYAFIKFNNVYRKVKMGEINQENWKAFIDGTKDYLKDNSDWQSFNNIAWFVYENYKKINDTESLKLAKEWALKSTQIDRNAQNLDTYANITYDLNNSEEALKYEEEALTIAKKDNNDADLIKSLNERFEYFKANPKK